mmetsp:Transcript_2146/g.3776  ORF Transcript_2146/g.3776 Transcript_2146/m.3776 type:complete len:131 (-) Transcript_2146:37-429(-)|eukprot:CAMPEP_0116550766 /NCGR_PEP_ID=MMETSP0397-20121206/5603_1 /TAXON_ID=216820 /ORGANISM="Cyclophora tenuis, Strain ECT3854" /LENGTH=130 /DNA_ID=CAMNT_0004075621 /DNA_START=37 /DNA_END=429 /DNA_ORIENTATION=+
MSQSSIPLMKKPANLLETGLNGGNLAAAAVQRHPVDEMQRNPFDDLDHVRRMYGRALAMTLATERQMASQVGGLLPGMDGGYGVSSNCMLETVTGNDTKIDFSDYLSRPENLPVAPTVDAHKAMERKLGL